jgi:hypothetical protein
MPLTSNGGTECWGKVEETLPQFQGATGFEGPCELVVAVGTK